MPYCCLLPLLSQTSPPKHLTNLTVRKTNEETSQPPRRSLVVSIWLCFTPGWSRQIGFLPSQLFTCCNCPSKVSQIPILPSHINWIIGYINQLYRLYWFDGGSVSLDSHLISYSSSRLHCPVAWMVTTQVKLWLDQVPNRLARTYFRRDINPHPSTTLSLSFLPLLNPPFHFHYHHNYGTNPIL